MLCQLAVFAVTVLHQFREESVTLPATLWHLKHKPTYTGLCALYQCTACILTVTYMYIMWCSYLTSLGRSLCLAYSTNTTPEAQAYIHRYAQSMQLLYQVQSRRTAMTDWFDVMDFTSELSTHNLVKHLTLLIFDTCFTCCTVSMQCSVCSSPGCGTLSSQEIAVNFSMQSTSQRRRYATLHHTVLYTNEYINIYIYIYDVYICVYIAAAVIFWSVV